MLNATRSRDKNTCNVEVANNPHVKNDQDKTIRIAWWVLAVAVFSLTTAVRIRLLGIPLERDEGEYAYAGQLLLQGIPPYKLAYSMKRSEEHTSELQSLTNLVCRLLLEKKNTKDSQ